MLIQWQHVILPADLFISYSFIIKTFLENAPFELFVENAVFSTEGFVSGAIFVARYFFG